MCIMYDAIDKKHVKSLIICISTENSYQKNNLQVTTAEWSSLHDRATTFFSDSEPTFNGM